MAKRGRCERVANVKPRTPMTNEKIWTEEEKQEWLAAHGAAATHVVTFEPMYQIEVCVPPWEHPNRQIARSAVAWGESMNHVFTETYPGEATVVAAHHEGNSLEVYTTVKPRPHLHRVI
jgi:hypothetical protein